jgi:cyclic beta-1,2-glucan synthetase
MALKLLSLVPGAHQALGDLLDPARGPVLPPIRSEIFGLQRFAQHGASLAETHRAVTSGTHATSFFPRLRGNIHALRQAHNYIGKQASTGYDISPAAEWLLDNFHLIEAQLKEVHEGMPRSYFRALPVLVGEPLAGLPRVYGVAWAFVAHTDGAFDEALLLQFLGAYQQRCALNLNELWALPTTLRVVLIENLRRLAERVATNKAAREVANLCCDHIEQCPLPTLQAIHALLEERGVGRGFLVQLAQRLQDGRTAGDAPLHRWLDAALPNLAAIRSQQAADQAADNLSVSNAVTSLRAIGDADWPDIVASTSALIALMLGNPAFKAEHPATQDRTLHQIELLARRSGRGEAAVATALLGLMQSQSAGPSSVAGHWLNGPGRPALLKQLGLRQSWPMAWRDLAPRGALAAYLGSMLLGTCALMGWLLLRHGAAPPGTLLAGWLAGLGVLCMLFPASEAVVAVVNRLISESIKPMHLPRLALAQGIPPEHQVMVVVPAMLTSEASLRALAHRLLLHDLANAEPNTQFALLTDFADADTQHTPGDSALLAAAVDQIHALNARAGARAGAGAPDAPRYIVLHRERQFCLTEQRWIGWERKRGKLEQLVNALATGNAAPFLDLGQASRMAPGTRYIVTLDSDTELPPGRLRALVGVAAHPYNQPRLSEDGQTVEHGYGILQPRVATPLPPQRDFTLYHWLFAGQCGIDPYSAASSEVYQDLFGEGSFSGKGLLNVAAMQAVLTGRLPDGQVLSHDLLEGSLARCASVSDISVIEEAPFHADVAAARVHRWTRGDWQLLPFLLNPARYRLRAINRWKMFDNLRRSLVAPMSLALVVLALCGLTLSPVAALLLVLAAFSAGPLMGGVAGLLSDREDLALRLFYRRSVTDLARALWGAVWLLGQLAQQAAQALDAIVRSLHRMGVSRRHLLQWTTAEVSQTRAQTGLLALARQHRNTPLAMLLLLAVLLGMGTPYPLLALVLCALWAASPVGIWLVSRRRPQSPMESLATVDQDYLAGVARDTWRLFERCVTAQDSHLPPDNLQTAPHDMLAHRTSPTNIGLYLLSTACARQFGWIGTQELLARLQATLGTLAGLQRYRGHFYNWYDTLSGAPLLPMYVSTVDSGNLSGHLLAVAQACRELASAPFADNAPAHAVLAARARLAPLLARRRGLTPALRDELRWCLADCRATGRSAQLDAQASAPQRQQAGARLLALAAQCEQLAWDADWRFLYHPKRHLLHIGFRVQEQQLDASFYDLLASESRLTSLLAIAKGDLPASHWAALGRPFYAAGSHAGLRSWSGSMFEYLMPLLVLDEPHGSALYDAARAAVHEQMAFGKSQDVPWGMSESAYAGRDHTLAYQYAPQGVPRLALRRTPQDELVVAPYATALATQIDPLAACHNLRVLQQLHTRSRYGFIEALDFSPVRHSAEGAFAPVHTFMAHHQGMTIVALANVLLGGVARRWGMANDHIEAVASLLQEAPPREVSNLYTLPAIPPPRTLQRRASELLREVVPGESALAPTHMLSNGRYNVSLRANGAGCSRWGQTGITRWRDDALRDARGSFFYLRRDAQAPLVSLTQHPAPDARAHYTSTYHADRVCFDAAWPDLLTHITVWVSPEDDVEFRRVELRNLGEQTLEIELVSAFEVTLASAAADEAHPAFSNLFLRAQWLAAQQALVFERRPRSANETGLQAAHFITSSDAEQLGGLRLQCDRQLWQGRNRDASRPLGRLNPVPAGDPAALGADGQPEELLLDTGLDPVCALSMTLRLAPNAKAQLTFATAVSDNGAQLRALLDKYRQPSHVQRASLMSTTLTGIRLRSLRISAENFAAIQVLTTALVFGLTRARPGRSMGAPGGEVCDRRQLWRLGISGERALIVVTVGATDDLGLLRSLVQGLRLWSWGGISVDLVVVNTEPVSYQMTMQRGIVSLHDRYIANSGGDHGGAVTTFHALRADELSAAELATLAALARVRLHADGRPLRQHVHEWLGAHEQALDERQAIASTRVGAAHAPLAAQPPAGEFDAGSGEFRFDAGAGVQPARPWANVMANPGFGAQLTEAGGGYSWAVNSRLNQLTAWSNDPVADTPSEWFLLQDLKTQQVWSVAPGAWADPAQAYRVAHGQGYSVISHRANELEVSATWCVDAHSAVKQVRLRIVNRGHRGRQLRLVGLAEWMMGANRGDRASTHTAVLRQRLQTTEPAAMPGQPALDQQLTALLCTQREQSAGFGGGTAFLALASPVSETPDWTCDRRECFDATGALVLPDHFDQASGSGLDPCAALSTRLMLGAGETVERVFLLGFGDSPQAAQLLALDAAAQPAAQRMAQAQAQWDQLLGATTVTTPDPLFDALVNRWLLYQTVSCRMWAKAGFYQAGGATGYRDQLQDAMALSWAAPGMLRSQIVLAASRQFAQGDVQHWWHAPLGNGVRTHFSDDLLWLPHACLPYLRATGDLALLDERVPFIEGAVIPEGAEDAYYTPGVSDDAASVYEHAARALDHSLRVGVHGLPLMGSGDWNDGMNQVGHLGRGESVWLAWFLCQLVADFAPLARTRGDTARADRWEDAARGWASALQDAAWDGQWYRRAFFDDHSPLGSQANTEARIDLIAQAWAVLSAAAPPQRQLMAMQAVEQHLVDHEAGLLRLLTPPLAFARPSAGYIQAYPPGIRENGGQYSHAGIWALMAQAELTRTLPEARGGGDTVWRYFTYLSPAHRARHPTRGPAYGLEPYVMAGDVYSQPPYVGRGGWSWYTGAAAWLHRAAIESIFGLRQGVRSLSLQPCLPSHWPRAELTLMRDGRRLHFILLRAPAATALAVAAVPGARLLLPGDMLQWRDAAAPGSYVVPLRAGDEP